MTNMRKLLACLSLLVMTGACSRITEPDPIQRDPANKPAAPTPTGAPAPPTAAATELQKLDLKLGTGAEAVKGKKVKVHYTGTLTDGSKFDSSVDRGDPFTFQLGGGQVIKGWDEGVAGMKVGGKRKLTIPYAMAYGEEGRPPKIPPKATLLFDIELLGVE
jgi:FKBP-type peptidyl-prolyl cis-trans isomerase